ncbi:hypothetical protein NMY22_g18907 [Coprinellus aureogranulatus]|nr:hypothetical protein NMY22_g18907 [Coprinellus aureogranulatus]
MLLPCNFCSRSGHTQPNCFTFQHAQEQARKNTMSGGRKRCGQQANKAQEPAATSGATEFAGNASAVPGVVNPSSLIQPHADFRWNADSGCTSTMTPHRHWIHNYRPHCVAVELADGSVIYSAGVGTVVIDPVIDGKGTASVELTCVLHVPQLRCNLLSCLFLTRCCGFNILIDSTFMHFKQSGMTLFRARITSSNTAFVEGTTLPAVESACAIQTRPLDWQLWHERLCHHNIADIAKLISGGLAIGISLSSSEKRDPVCEPCLAVMLKRQSECFTAFKSFQALAERQLGQKIKSLHDDKGGEYMSDEFNKYCDDSGILRRHTTRNRPQQNGDAERANRTMLEDVSAMLYQAKLPPSFWGRCLATQVRVWNCLPTSALPGKTPYEAWWGNKPDLSLFRAFGCVAYVYIQKDKRKKLESHMEKAIFVGYPAGYKGWEFQYPDLEASVIHCFLVAAATSYEPRALKLSFVVIQKLDAPTRPYLEITVLNPKGRIRTTVAGCGPSIVYSDDIAGHGFTPELAAHHGEYFGARSQGQAYEYAKTIIHLIIRGTPRPDSKILIIGGGIANFTNVATTFKGII